MRQAEHEAFDELVSTSRAAEIARVKPATIRQWKHRGWLAPAGLDAKGRAMYRVRDVKKAEAGTRERDLTRRVDPRVPRPGV